MVGLPPSVLATALLSALALAAPYSDPVSVVYAVKDSHKPPIAWSQVERAPTDHLLDVSIGLKQHRFSELERVLYQVSDPKHSSYGQYLSDNQVADLIRPSEETTQSVAKWLETAGYKLDKLNYSPARDWIRFTATVGEIEDLLKTTYHMYEHVDGSTLVRTEAWSLPIHLHDHISVIQPTNSFARLNGRAKPTRELTRRSTSNIEVEHFDLANDPCPQQHWGNYPPDLSADAAAVAAACNFSAALGTTKMGHTNYLEEYSNRSDTSLFLQKYRPEAAAVAQEFPEISIAGGDVDNGTNTADQAPDTGLEANLDTQTMLGIGWPVPLTVWSTGGRNPTFMPDALTTTNSDEPFLVWAQYVTAQPADSLPQVISNSYADDEQTVSKSYAEAVCNQFAQLGAKGISVLFASGDNGVGPDGLCVSNIDNTTNTFLPSFPCDCPYFTNVGATTGFPESAAYDTFSDGSVFTSGAGFSNYFSQPDYQVETVQAYLAGVGDEYKGLNNPQGRAYPDISCNGQRYNIVWNGTGVRLDGTSASTPACSAILSLVNDALIAAGRPTLGFLNPWLYSGGYKLFTDITNGSSAGCNTSGFPAAEGWDAVTGFGTPYLPRLLQGLGLSD